MYLWKLILLLMTIGTALISECLLCIYDIAKALQ